MLSVRQLKEILARNFVNYTGCCEKWELMERVRRLYQDQQNLLGQYEHQIGSIPGAAGPTWSATVTNRVRTKRRRTCLVRNANSQLSIHHWMMMCFSVLKMLRNGTAGCSGKKFKQIKKVKCFVLQLRMLQKLQVCCLFSL